MNLTLLFGAEFAEIARLKCSYPFEKRAELD